MASSSVTKPTVEVSRNVKDPTRLDLCVRAGGRCEFNGCNTYLFEEPLTGTTGFFGQVAHIHAFSLAGPRGKSPNRPAGIHDIVNLLLLCPIHHKLVDDHPDDFSIEALKKYKGEHEERVRMLGDLGPDRATFALLVTAPIARMPTPITREQVNTAVAPRYPRNRPFAAIDLGSLDDRAEAFYAAGRGAIDLRMSELQRPGSELLSIGHLSLFALAPMPLLLHLGSRISDKLQVQFFQRHRDTGNWTWMADGAPVTYDFRCLREGDPSRVALILSLSGRIPLESLPEPEHQSATVYELTIRDQAPHTGFLRREDDLQRFINSYQEALGEIISKHGLLPSIDVFPAVPAPVAVACGYCLLPKVSPSLRVYDFDKLREGFTYSLTIN